MECDVQGEAIKDIVAPALFFLGFLVLGESSYPVTRTSRQPSERTEASKQGPALTSDM